MEDLPADILEKLARVTKLLKTQRTLPAKLEAVVALVKRTIPICDAAGVCLFISGEPTSIARSAPLRSMPTPSTWWRGWPNQSRARP